MRAASHDTLDMVASLIPAFVNEVNKTLDQPAPSGEGRDKQAELQGQLCGVLMVGG